MTRRLTTAPSTFREVVGQQYAVDALKRLVDGKRAITVVLTGPVGNGKTTLAILAAKTYLCIQKTEDGEACGRCISCSNFRANGGGNYLYLNCVNVGVEAASQLDTFFGAESRLAVVLDEIHDLKGRAAEIFLPRLQQRPNHLAVFACTSRPDKVNEALMNRLNALPVHPISSFLMYQHASKLCTEFGIVLEDGALRSLVNIHLGSLRSLLLDIDFMSQVGGLTMASVAAKYEQPVAPAVLGFLLSVCAQSNGTLDVLSDTPLPDRFRQTALLIIEASYELGAFGVHRFDARLGVLGVEKLQEIFEAIEQRAELSGQRSDILWRKLFDVWSGDVIPWERGHLLVALREFSRLMSGEDRRELPPGYMVSEAFFPYIVPIVRAPQTGRAEMEKLSGETVLRLWNAASFSIQAYGQDLNTLIELEFATGLVDAQKLMGKLLHELGMFIKRRINNDFTNTYLGVASGGECECVASIACHVPPRCAFDANNWLTRKFRSRFERELVNAIMKTRVGATRQQQSRFQHDHVRALSRDLDPTATITFGNGVENNLREYLTLQPQISDKAAHSYSIAECLNSKAQTNSQSGAIAFPAFGTGSLSDGWEWRIFERRLLKFQPEG